MLLPFVPLLDDRPRPTTPYELSWALHPSVIIGTGLLGALYFWGIGPLRRRQGLGPPAAPWQVASLLRRTRRSAGVAQRPDPRPERLLPLLGPHGAAPGADTPLSAAPDRGNSGLAPEPAAPTRRRSGGWHGCWHIRWSRRPSITATIAAWHVAAAYDLMMRNHDVHIATHIMFMVTATMMWWPVMSPSPEVPRLSRGLGMLYLFLVGIPMQLVAALITLADEVSIPGIRRRRGPGGSRRSTISSSAGCSCGCRGISGSSWQSASSSSSGRTKANRTHSNRGNPMGTPSAPVTPQPDDPALARVLEPLRSLLIPGEQLEAYAVQRRIFALVHRRVAIGSTTGRLISTIRGLFGGFTADDVRWQDLNDADIRVGILGATLSVTAFVTRDLASTEGAQRTLVFTGLRKKPGAGGVPAVSGPGAVVAGEAAGAGPRRAASEIRRDPARSGSRQSWPPATRTTPLRRVSSGRRTCCRRD